MGCLVLGGECLIRDVKVMFGWIGLFLESIMAGVVGEGGGESEVFLLSNKVAWLYWIGLKPLWHV